MSKATTVQAVTIKAPNFQTAKFTIKGEAPLVLHRWSEKAKREMAKKQETGKASSSVRHREAQDLNEVFNAARYVSKDGWDGFHAASIRNAMISACRLVGYKMTLAKLSLFVVPDGWDAKEPQIPLIRINGTAVRQDDLARVDNGNPYVTVRPVYHNWSADVTIRWDADQFTVQDVANLLSRVGQQVGIGEGRPDSKNSAGMGWGLFTVES